MKRLTFRESKPRYSNSNTKRVEFDYPGPGRVYVEVESSRGRIRSVEGGISSGNHDAGLRYKNN